MEMIYSMKPNMWSTLADEVPAWVSEKRNTASVDRTVRWLDDCLTSTLAKDVCANFVIFTSIMFRLQGKELKRFMGNSKHLSGIVIDSSVMFICG